MSKYQKHIKSYIHKYLPNVFFYDLISKKKMNPKNSMTIWELTADSRNNHSNLSLKFNNIQNKTSNNNNIKEGASPFNNEVIKNSFGPIFMPDPKIAGRNKSQSQVTWKLRNSFRGNLKLFPPQEKTRIVHRNMNVKLLSQTTNEKNIDLNNCILMKKSFIDTPNKNSPNDEKRIVISLNMQQRPNTKMSHLYKYFRKRHTTALISKKTSFTNIHPEEIMEIKPINSRKSSDIKLAGDSYYIGSTTASKKRVLYLQRTFLSRNNSNGGWITTPNEPASMKSERMDKNGSVKNLYDNYMEVSKNISFAEKHVKINGKNAIIHKADNKKFLKYNSKITNNIIS